MHTNTTTKYNPEAGTNNVCLYGTELWRKQSERTMEQLELNMEQPEPNLEQPELHSGPFRFTFPTGHDPLCIHKVCIYLSVCSMHCETVGLFPYKIRARYRAVIESLEWPDTQEISILFTYVSIRMRFVGSTPAIRNVWLTVTCQPRLFHHYIEYQFRCCWLSVKF